MIHWIYLIAAGGCEMVGVLMINKLHQERNRKSLLMLFAGFGASFLFLSLAMQALPMGTAYAVWTGIGASGGAILGMLYYGEPRTVWRLLWIALIISAAVGLKLVS